MSNASEQAKTDQLVDQLMGALANLVNLKIRLPTLKAIIDEFAAMGSGAELRARNDIVLQLVRDSFDMLVIDLASLCEGVTKGGLFEALKHDCDRLRRFTAMDVKSGTIWVGDRPAEADYWDEQHRADMARRWNDVFDRLFPGKDRVTADDVAQLIARFRKAVEPTDKDRNRVRAHRFERHVDASHFQSIDEVSAQIDLVDRYLNDLLLVLTKGTYSTKPVSHADSHETATDLADIIVQGSIERAENVYRGGAPGTVRRDSYAAARAAYFASSTRA